jgi:ABC-type multidrug transport system permease subunit
MTNEVTRRSIATIVAAASILLAWAFIATLLGVGALLALKMNVLSLFPGVAVLAILWSLPVLALMAVISSLFARCDRCNAPLFPLLYPLGTKLRGKAAQGLILRNVWAVVRRRQAQSYGDSAFY